MSKEELIDYFISKKTGTIAAIRMRWHNIKCHPEIYDFMVNYFPGVDDTNTSSIELLYRIVNDIYEVPKCPICGKPAEFQRWDRGYRVFCKDCLHTKKARAMITEKTRQVFNEKYGGWMTTCDDVKEKAKQTNKKKYGGNSPTCSKEIAQKQIATKRAIYGEHMEKVMEKVRQTNLERTGYEYPTQDHEIRQKMLNTCNEKYGGNFNPAKRRQTNLEKYGVEEYASSEDIKIKRQKTLQEHYGVDIPLQSEEIRNKQKQTMIDKYGVDHNFKRPEVIEKSKSPEQIEKWWETRKRNGHTNTSIVEEQFAAYLNEHGYNFIRNYKSEKYPYHVDFYIVDYNLYVEIQGYWTHGLHPFDENNEDDLKQINEWEKKSKTFNYKGEPKVLYKNAIKVWTVRDVAKRRIAKENGLNYLEIFSCDVNECISQFEAKINK